MRNYPNCLLDPAQTAILIVDHQPQMYFGIESVFRSIIMNNVIGLAETARIFKVPCILTTIEAETFSGMIYSKLQEIFKGQKPIDRTSINAWEDTKVREAIENTKKKKIIIAGLWTEACVTFPALSMINDGYGVYVVTDSSGGATKEAHDMAIQRMIKAGVVPLTTQQLLLEFQRDWGNKTTYNAVMTLIKQIGGAYGLGVEYTETML